MFFFLMAALPCSRKSAANASGGRSASNNSRLSIVRGARRPLMRFSVFEGPAGADTANPFSDASTPPNTLVLASADEVLRKDCFRMVRGDPRLGDDTPVKSNP